MEKISLLFFFSINIFSFLIMGFDKSQAKIKGWRVREKTLLLLALGGGALGAFLGMKVFRHKTKHALFKFGLPLLFLLNVFIWVFLGGEIG